MFTCKGVENGNKLVGAMSREFNSFGNGIYHPTEKQFSSFPTCVAFIEFLDGDGLFARRMYFVRCQRTKDVIDGMEKLGADLVTEVGISLGKAQEIIHINIDIRKRSLWCMALEWSVGMYLCAALRRQAERRR